jgi:hypothetical protein
VTELSFVAGALAPIGQLLVMRPAALRYQLEQKFEGVSLQPPQQSVRWG